MTRLLLVRHARTAWNAIGRAQGQADTELDDVGRAQAARLAPQVATYRPVRLWTSDLSRAADTAAELGQVSGLTPEPDERLREFDVGERSGLTSEEFAERFPEEHRVWLAGEEHLLVPGAESTSEVAKRIVPAVEECWAALGAGETGVVVTHGWALKVALGGLLGWPPETTAGLVGLDNCAWAEVAGPRERPRLLAYNVMSRPAEGFTAASPG